MDFKGFHKRCGRLRRRIGACLQQNNEGKSIAPLSSNCRAGRKKICKIAGDRKLCAKMAAMGMYPGEEIEVICAQGNAQCILKVHGGTVSLDALTSEKILVESL